jgi:EAL domain-containing protein (putative c-di-GMP-specific phosphodiesterase class I)
MEDSCRQMSAWDEDLLGDRKLYLSVNVSVQQLLDPAFVGEVLDVLERTGFDPSRLTLEITESITMYPGDATMTALNQLKEIGARLAIDDFGTGSSSYAYFRTSRSMW